MGCRLTDGATGSDDDAIGNRVLHIMPDCEHAMCVALQTMEAVYIGGDLSDAYHTLTQAEDDYAK